MDVQKYIRLHGDLIPVSDEVYEIYRKSARKAHYFTRELKHWRIKVDAENESVLYLPAREDSLDRLIDDNNQQFSDESVSVEDVACYQLLRKALYSALTQLSKEEQMFINSLFFEGLTEEELGVRLGITQQAVNKRKLKILKKLRILLKT